jgi:hypothetical protein
MMLVTNSDCRTATLTGSLQWKIKEVDSVVQPEPDRYILGVEGVRVLGLETRDIDHTDPSLTRQWHSTPVSLIEGGRHR